MGAFDGMQGAGTFAKAERQLNEALGIRGADSTRATRDLHDSNSLANEMKAISRAMEEALGATVGLGGSRRPRASDVFGTTVADALGTGLGSLGGPRRPRASDVFGETVADALGTRIGGYAKAQDRLREAFGTTHFNELEESKFGRRAADEAARQLAEVASSISRPHRIPEGIRLPEPPPNPVHETNRYLRQVADKIDALLEVQAQQAGLIDALLKAQVAAAAEQNRTWRRDHRFAVIGLVVSLLALLVSIAL